MGRRKYKPDTEVLDGALTAVEDPFAVRELLANAPLGGALDERVEYASQNLRPEITRLFRRGVWDYVMAGRLLKAAETLIGRGKKEDDPYQQWVDASGWNEDFVRLAVRFVDVVARFPEAIDLPPGKGLRNLLHWSTDRIEEFLRDEIGEKNLQGLTPQKLLDVYREKVKETRQERIERERRESAQKLRRWREKRVAQGLPPDDPPLSAFELAYMSVVTALKRLEMVFITDADRERICSRDVKMDLCNRWDDMWENNPGWPPIVEIPFKVPDHMKGLVPNK